MSKNTHTYEHIQKEFNKLSPVCKAIVLLRALSYMERNRVSKLHSMAWALGYTYDRIKGIYKKRK